MSAVLAKSLALGIQGFQQGQDERTALRRGIAENNLAAERARISAKPENLRLAEEQSQAESQLATTSATIKNDPAAMRDEVATLRAQNQQITGQIARQKTFDMLRAYDADSHVKHLDNAMRKDPILSDIYKDILSVEKLDMQNDAKIIRESGIMDLEDGPNMSQEALQHRFLKVTRPDGTKEVVDILDLQAATGYLNALNATELEQYGPGELEKTARFVAETTEQPLDEVTSALYNKKVAGVTPGQIAIAEKAEEKLLETFGGPEKFFATDFSDKGNRMLASREIRAMEQAGGDELAAADRADLKDINTLIVSADIVSEELTPEATGILDNFTSNVQKYLDDQGIAQTEARAAYNAYRNALLRSFGGTAMSESEVKNFERAFGSLSQKFPAVISQFRQALLQTKAKLETVARLNNPYIAHYYLGTSQDDLDIITSRMENTLARLSKFETKAKDGTANWKKNWETAKK
jgi:hypothetical protein